MSKAATIGFALGSNPNVTCGIQAVAIEPPRVSAVKRVDTASIAPARDSVALFFHCSRIFQASPRDGPDLAPGRGATARASGGAAPKPDPHHAHRVRGSDGGATEGEGVAHEATPLQIR